MAKTNMFRFLFSLFMTCSAFYGSDARAIGFNIPSENNIHVSGDAFISNGVIELTPRQSSLGWATFSNLVPLQALTSFSAHFQFSMAAVNGSGDGLTFFLAPSSLQSSDAERGEWLGLFRSETDGNSSNQILAVEFDTYKDDFDPDDNHVGIDVNGVRSQKTVSVSDLFGDAALNNGGKWDAWVEYYGPLAQVQVFLLQNPRGVVLSRPGNPVLWYDIDLSQFLSPVVKAGISASTGIEAETHTVHSWSFACQDSSETLTPTLKGRRKHRNGIVVVIVVLIAFILAFMIVKWQRRRTSPRGVGVKKNGQAKRTSTEAAGRSDRGSGGDESYDELDKRFAREIQPAKKFAYSDLCAATKNFSEDQKIGEGGFGKVYKGTLPRTNQAVAVKKMNKEHGEVGQEMYESEVTINGRLTHRNLVEFLGWCHTKVEKLLVYEYLPNRSLDKYLLFENTPNGIPLDCEKRYMIARDVAAVLVYLHHDRRESVLHKDIKAENVMLDSDFRAKLGDFGLARALKCGDEGDNSYESAPRGTRGYVAPEYIMGEIFTRESDVFSFGALALVIACGKRPIDESLDKHKLRLVEWVWHLHAEDRILDAADKKLNDSSNDERMKRLMLVGLWCSHPVKEKRPSMKQVLHMLERGDKLPDIPSRYPQDSPKSSTE